MLSLLFAVVAAVSTPDADTATLTAIVADVAGGIEGISVVTRRDLAQLLEMQASQQELGCDTGSDSCIAEIAAAVGAEIIVRTELGLIDDQRSLSISVLNSTNLTVTARSVVRGRTIGALGDEVARVLPGLVTKVRGASAAPTTTRIFVTDTERTGGEAPSGATVASGAQPSGGEFNLALTSGVVTVVVGALALGVAGYSELQVAADQTILADPSLTRSAAQQSLDHRDEQATIAKVAWIVGGALVVVGGVLMGVGMIE